MNQKLVNFFRRSLGLCPMPDEVSDTFGVDWTVSVTLSAILFRTFLIFQTVESGLYRRLSESILRKFDEPVGKHEKYSKSHKTFMSPFDAVRICASSVFLRLPGEEEAKQRTISLCHGTTQSAVKISHHRRTTCQINTQSAI